MISVIEMIYAGAFRSIGIRMMYTRIGWVAVEGPTGGICHIKIVVKQVQF